MLCTRLKWGLGSQKYSSTPPEKVGVNLVQRCTLYGSCTLQLGSPDPPPWPRASTAYMPGEAGIALHKIYEMLIFAYL